MISHSVYLQVAFFWWQHKIVWSYLQ